MEKNKSSQITIFVIVAVLLVVLIVIIFFSKISLKKEVIDENNPQPYIESCVREATEDAIKILSEHGGDINPKGFVKYNGTDIVYLCYTNNYYQYCTNQRPLLVEHIEKEISNYITPIVKECFINLENNLKKRYDVETEDMKLTTKLYPNQVVVEINKKFRIYRENKKREFEYFKMNIVSPIYNFAEIATEVSNQEAKYCNFDHLGFMILYPRFDIESTITGESDRIYVITERSTNQKFHFAIRSCPLPPGY